MVGTALERFGLAGLARATQNSLDWRNWRQNGRQCQFDKTRPSDEVLDKLVETEIIPRLMLAHAEAAEETALARTDAPNADTPLFNAEEIDRFARMTVSRGPEEVVEFIDQLLTNGADAEDVLMKLLAPAARRLGELWEEDRVDFTEVTIGLMKLHRALQRVNRDAPCGVGAGRSAPRILLGPADGEQHVFGLLMVGELFCRSGWRVRCETSAKNNAVIAAVAEEHFDIVGLSASADDSLKPLAEEIRRIRSASLNPAVKVMVGGRVFNQDFGLVQRVGADAMAVDGVRAVVTAERMVHQLAQAEKAPQH